MTDNFSFTGPIYLPYNQSRSTVIDFIQTDADGNTTLQLANYGLVNIGEEDEDYFVVKYKLKPLTTERKISTIGTTTKTTVKSAETELTNSAVEVGGKGSVVVDFAIKSFPHYGPYGFVNYDDNLADYKSGEKLDKGREVGDIF